MSVSLKTIKARYKKIREEALPFLMFLLGLITSAILSEATTIFHELLKEWAGENYKNLRLVVFFGCLILLGYIFYLVHRDYIKPLSKAEDELDEVMKNKN
jgi:hypothetical protein